MQIFLSNTEMWYKESVVILWFTDHYFRSTEIRLVHLHKFVLPYHFSKSLKQKGRVTVYNSKDFKFTDIGVNKLCLEQDFTSVVELENTKLIVLYTDHQKATFLFSYIN